jgi:L-lactate dehydrogenase complex protein LldE
VDPKDAFFIGGAWVPATGRDTLAVVDPASEQQLTTMLADKMRHVLSTRAQVCTAGDASCLMHLGGGLSRLCTGVRTVHLAEILASTES